MTSPPDADGSRCPRAEPGPGVVLVCESCDHVWEPSFADLRDGPVTCTRCGGSTTIAELTEPDPQPTVIVTRYAVSIIPPEDPSARHFMITVERRAPIQDGGPWAWAVCHAGYSLTTNGRWDPDHLSPHSATQRYTDLDEALRLAKSWAPRVGTITYTAAQWLTRRASNNA